MNQKHNIWLYFFGTTSLVNIFAEATNNIFLIFSSKPLLMILLSIWFYLNVKENHTSFTKYILYGFIFSFFGDTFLMFNENGIEGEIWFLLGLGSFLITHICYIIAFLKFKPEKEGFISKHKWLAFPFLLFLLGNTVFLWEGIPVDLKIPVVIYSSAITGMVYFCLNLKSKLSLNLFSILLSGVLFFLISDSFIGINKFKMELSYARLLIMIPYLLGQFFIGLGAIEVQKKEILLEN